MPRVNDGGPMHPTRARMETEYTGTSSGSGSVTIQQAEHTGLSIRDYFAGQVLPSLLTEAYRQIREGRTSTKEDARALVVSTAYEIADAMLKERTRNG